MEPLLQNPSIHTDLWDNEPRISIWLIYHHLGANRGIAGFSVYVGQKSNPPSCLKVIRIWKNNFIIVLKKGTHYECHHSPHWREVQVEWHIVSIMMSSPSLVPFPRKSVAPWKSSKGGGPGDTLLFFLHMHRILCHLSFMIQYLWSQTFWW